MSTDEKRAASSDETAFDPARPWALDPQVSLRPEPFGALAYHFGTRRLSFLTSRRLLGVVETLATQPSAREACLAAGVTEVELGTYERALATLADRGMIRERVAS
ncbi:MAG: mycofactocin biosynthesis chaperone MftB [Acidimicrobiales bacterium]